MLRQTFCHFRGVGPVAERRLWDSGITSWDDVSSSGVSDLRVPRKEFFQQWVDQSKIQLDIGDAAFFANTLPSRHQWRMFPEFRNSVAYLDIETTGLSNISDHITTIALYDGANIRHYVYGQNLDAFPQDIQEYRLIVTYNGKTFDIPFIEHQFGIKIEHAHIDLRYVLHSLGYCGGLKSCEHQLHIDRGDLEGVDGYFAVILWAEYEQHENQKALDTLLAYNVQDVLNLELLMTIAYNAKLKETPFYDHLLLADRIQPCNPFSADRKTVVQLKHKYGWHVV